MQCYADELSGSLMVSHIVNAEYYDERHAECLA